MRKIGFHNFHTYMDGPMFKPGSGIGKRVMAAFDFEENISFLFPYINAVADKAQLHQAPHLIRFVFDGAHCVLYPERCIASPFEDREQAKTFTINIVDFLNDIADRKNQINPKHRVFKTIPVTDIIQLLPKTNCGDCSYATCIEFSAMVSTHRAHPSSCPHIGLPTDEQVTYPVYNADGAPVSFVTIDTDSSGKNSGTSDASTDASEIDTPENTTIERANATLAASLTKRELEVLSLMGLGHTNREISHQLQITAHTVKSHVIHIFNKLGVNHRTQAVVWAVRHGVI